MSKTALLCAGLLAALAPFASADEPRPGSVLVYPVHHADAKRFTFVSVTNSSLSTPVNAYFCYVSSGLGLVSPTPQGDCVVLDRAELLTPADTVTVLTACHAGASDNHGYLVVSSRSATSGFTVGHDHLIGSTLVIDLGVGYGGVYSVLPAAFAAVPPDGSPTDLDFDGQLDFDGIEYEQAPDDLFLDSFLGLGGSRLTLLNLSGEKNAVVTVQLFVWNDNERPTSAQFSFQCWFEKSLTDISPVFSENFLKANTPNDPDEVDIDCDGLDDLEAGWARISGSVAFGSFFTVPNPPLLGAVTGGKKTLEGGRLLWGSNARSNGEF